jgi:hypothetical protein
MTVEELRRLLIAPEIIVVDLADAALAALRRAILLEHPTVTEFPSADHSPVLVRAAIVLRCAARLRRAIRAYRRAVDRVLDEPPSPDLLTVAVLPFFVRNVMASSRRATRRLPPRAPPPARRSSSSSSSLRPA